MSNHLNRQLFLDEETNIFEKEIPLTEILLISSYPPRECGIANYSQDLVNALNDKFENSFKVNVCPIESDVEQHYYQQTPQYTLNTDHENSFRTIAKNINTNINIGLVVIQHEFGFFSKQKKYFINFVNAIAKPLVLVFHTVLPSPNQMLKEHILELSESVAKIIVMTKSSRKILMNDYGIDSELIEVIPHGTHLIAHTNKELLKNKYSFNGRRVLTTFGLLSSGKNIETTLVALPEIIKHSPNVLFLIIGKTHPGIIKQEGENYREHLMNMVDLLHLHQHVLFVNQFLSLSVLLEYLQLTDIYLFTSKDPNQAVSGTFSYALSCGCPVVTTPIPHALEALQNNAGVSIGFSNSHDLSKEVINLLNNEPLRKEISSHGLHYMSSSAWQNSALAHANLFKKLSHLKIKLMYKLPSIKLDHLKKMTTSFGIIQFCKLNEPDLESGYTLDDNARALIAMCQHYELTLNKSDLSYISVYLDFIGYCMDKNGRFKNYVSNEKHFTSQNESVNLADAGGRALWALGYTMYVSKNLPFEIKEKASYLFNLAIQQVDKVHSTRAMAFIIKSLYYANAKQKIKSYSVLITTFANRLVQMYKHETSANWHWFENYLTYGNSVIPEALLCAWLDSGKPEYRDIAIITFDFLLLKTMPNKSLQLISNKGWLHKGEESLRCDKGGEQPIDAAYTVMALDRFYRILKNYHYKQKMKIAFDWFLGLNHLNQTIYNPCTGGCYDGVEESSVNLNQGAESTISYLMARLTIEKSIRQSNYLGQLRFENHLASVSS